MKKSICVIGLGYVGLTFAMHSVRKGFQVDGIEINEETLTLGQWRNAFSRTWLI